MVIDIVTVYVYCIVLYCIVIVIVIDIIIVFNCTYTKHIPIL